MFLLSDYALNLLVNKLTKRWHELSTGRARDLGCDLWQLFCGTPNAINLPWLGMVGNSMSNIVRNVKQAGYHINRHETYPLVIENCPVIDQLPIKHGDFSVCYVTNYQRGVLGVINLQIARDFDTSARYTSFSVQAQGQTGTNEFH